MAVRAASTPRQRTPGLPPPDPLATGTVNHRPGGHIPTRKQFANVQQLRFRSFFL